MDKEELNAFLKRGMSSYQISNEIGLSPTTIRYWTKKYNLKKEEILKPKKIYKKQKTSNCVDCGIPVFSTNKRCKKCYKKIYSASARLNKSYVYVKPLNHFGRVNKNGFIEVHRFAAEIVMNKKIEYDDVIHHIDNNSRNNELNNLCLMSRSDHNKYHRKCQNNLIEVSIESLNDSGFKYSKLSDLTNKTLDSILSDYCNNF